MVTPATRARAAAQDGAEWLLNLDPGPLEAFCTRTIQGFRTPLSIHPARPHSSSTFIISTPDNRYTLRRAIHTSQNADLEREFRILAGLHPRSFPVPRPLIYCDNEKLIGSAFFITEYVEGRQYQDPIMPGASSAYRVKAYESLNGILAQLHSYDPRVIGVTSPNNGRNYVAEQVERCTKQYVAAKIEDVPELDQLIAWLPKNLPPDRPPRLVHGDFRIENIVFHPSEPQVIGVVNWKLSGLGDPIADAVYHFMAWILMGHNNSGGLTEQELADLGIPALEFYAASYAHRAGLKTIPHFETYFAYNLFRMAVMEGAAARGGKPKSVSSIRPIAALAWAFARRAGAN
jgi:aminoglycoside phosphotransferase (APT) family kinase protein